MNRIYGIKGIFLIDVAVSARGDGFAVVVVSPTAGGVTHGFLLLNSADGVGADTPHPNPLPPQADVPPTRGEGVAQHFN